MVGSSRFIRSTRATDGSAHGSLRRGSATSLRTARQFQLDFASPSASAKTATEFALGVNWYLTANIKWQSDYANTYFNGGAGTTADVKDRPNESVIESQLQICF